MPNTFITTAVRCDVGPEDAAEHNTLTLTSWAFAPFRRPENGWAPYEPLIAHEVGTECPAVSPGFAATLAHWQSARGLAAGGVMDETTFALMVQAWQKRRPFVAANRIGCPAGADEAALATVPADDSYGGKPLQLTAPALAAYLRLLAAGRAESHQVAEDKRLLTIFSAYRSPEYDAARCTRDGNCQGITRAACSPHRTGTAIDVYLGAAPGYGPDDSADPNRLFISRSPAYRWLVRNADRFGFSPYAFEPWHWEWTGGEASPVPWPSERSREK